MQNSLKFTNNIVELYIHNGSFYTLLYLNLLYFNKPVKERLTEK